MIHILHSYAKGIHFTGDLRTDVFSLFSYYGYTDICNHCCDVAEETVRLAERFGTDTKKAETAGLLHDIGAIIPNDKRIEYSDTLKIEVFTEEKTFPMLLHPKYSKLMACELFGISDEEILNAIECHSTLKPNPTKMDMVLFLADKLCWDQSGAPPFADRINEGLKISLVRGSLAFIEYLMEDKSRLKIIHPWLQAAYDDLK